MVEVESLKQSNYKISRTIKSLKVETISKWMASIKNFSLINCIELILSCCHCLQDMQNIRKHDAKISYIFLRIHIYIYIDIYYDKSDNHHQKDRQIRRCISYGEFIIWGSLIHRALKTY